jgi:uncharacterized protein
MRLVLDSNVLIAAFVARGVCAELLEHCVKEHEPVVSEFILEEVQRNLVSKAGVAVREAGKAVSLLRSRFEVVEPTRLPAESCRDANDVVVIGTAVAGHCELLVTGDRDLLDLERYENVRIVSPAAFWRVEVESPPNR